MSSIARQARLLDALQADPFDLPRVLLPVDGDRLLVKLLTLDRPLSPFEQAYVDRAEREAPSC